MIQHLPLLPIFLIFLLASCTSRKPAEEGELFLQTVTKERNTLKSDNERQAHRLRLFAAEQQFDFTPRQLLTLKQLQLSECAFLNESLSAQLSAETDVLAISLGNDTLLCEARWSIFRNYQSRHDTTAALHVLKLQEPLVRKLYGSSQLSPYYYAMALLYNYHNKADQNLYWLNKARPSKAHLLYSWYNMIAEASLSAQRYPDALLFADSVLQSPGKRANSAASYVKGQALYHLNRTNEALSWYAGTILAIDSFRTKRAIKSYSLYQYRVLYAYASLLQQTGKTHSAIKLLDQIASISYSPALAIGNTLENKSLLPISTARLLAECYRLTGQKEESFQYIHQADSLQSALNKQQREINTLRVGEELRSELLNTELIHQTKEAEYARLAQHILSGVVLLLLAVIAGGLLWWRNHRRHLRQLFELLTSRHAAWLEIHNPPAMLAASTAAPTEPQPALPLSDTLQTAPTEGDVSQAIAYRRLYHRVLEVMKKERPFLNPSFDLVALSRLVGTNRTLLSTSLNRQTGMNFSCWLAEYRVNYLIEQIDRNPGKDISELYPLAGFTSRTSFFRQFRQATGLTPSQYMARRTM